MGLLAAAHRGQHEGRASSTVGSRCCQLLIPIALWTTLLPLRFTDAGPEHDEEGSPPDRASSSPILWPAPRRCSILRAAVYCTGHIRNEGRLTELRPIVQRGGSP